MIDSGLATLARCSNDRMPIGRNAYAQGVLAWTLNAAPLAGNPPIQRGASGLKSLLKPGDPCGGSRGLDRTGDRRR